MPNDVIRRGDLEPASAPIATSAAAPVATAPSGLAKWALIPPRLMLGVGFLYHGIPKLFGGHEGFATMLGGLGLPFPDPLAWLVGIVEVVGAVALLTGAFVRWASAILIVEMLVALYTVHLEAGFNFIHIVGMDERGAPLFGVPGYEVNLLYIALLSAVFLWGRSPFSLRLSRGGGATAHTAERAGLAGIGARPAAT